MVRFLVAVDNSDAAISALDAVFEGFVNIDKESDEIFLFHSVYINTEGISKDVDISELESVAKLRGTRTLKRFLERCHRNLGSSHLKIVTFLSTQPPAQGVIELAKTSEIDFIFIGNRGLSKIARAALGSVSEAVICKAECHVFVIKPKGNFLKQSSLKSSSSNNNNNNNNSIGEDRPLKKVKSIAGRTILLAVNDSDESFQAFDYIYEQFIHSTYSDKLVLLTVCPPPLIEFVSVDNIDNSTNIELEHEANMQNVISLKLVHLQNLRKNECLKLLQTYENRLNSSSKNSNIQVITMMKEGNAGDEICEAVDETNCDVVVVASSRLRSPIDNALVDSVSLHVVRHSHSSVFVLKLKGNFEFNETSTGVDI